MAPSPQQSANGKNKIDIRLIIQITIIAGGLVAAYATLFGDTRWLRTDKAEAAHSKIEEKVDENREMIHEQRVINAEIRGDLKNIDDKLETIVKKLP